MYKEGQITLAVLHDLALLYLALAHGTDEELHPHETKTIAARLRSWQPDKDPALIDHVIREATLTYLDGTSEERLWEAVAVLKKTLPLEIRTRILHDLSEIARADGAFIRAEHLFIEQIAREFEVEKPSS
jgi:uncharacterized tellurite resistance protein B-like protein